MPEVDLVFPILLTWKSVIKSKVISHGYEISYSVLSMLGVDEYSQLDHEEVQAQKSAPHRESF